MLYEHRHYTATPGSMPALHARFESSTLEVFARHGFHVVGLWQPAVGAILNELHYLLRWNSDEAREAGWQAFLSDPDWQRARDESERHGPLLARIDTELWAPAPYAPLP
jgi:hypothetical protein